MLAGEPWHARWRVSGLLCDSSQASIWTRARRKSLDDLRNLWLITAESVRLTTRLLSGASVHCSHYLQLLELLVRIVRVIFPSVSPFGESSFVNFICMESS